MRRQAVVGSQEEAARRRQSGGGSKEGDTQGRERAPRWLPGGISRHPDLYLCLCQYYLYHFCHFC